MVTVQQYHLGSCVLPVALPLSPVARARAAVGQTWWRPSAAVSPFWSIPTTYSNSGYESDKEEEEQLPVKLHCGEGGGNTQRKVCLSLIVRSCLCVGV